MALFTPRFRTRSPNRDQETDARRRESVRSAVHNAVREAEREMSGLEERISDAYLHAAVAVDEAAEYGSRAPAEEREISDFEREAEAGRRRLADLRAEIAVFYKILAVLEPAVGTAEGKEEGQQD